MALGALLAFAVLVAVWIALAGVWDVQDLVGGSCAAGLAVAVGFMVSKRGRALPGLQLGDLRRLGALPAQVVLETGRVLLVAARQGLGHGGHPVGSWSTISIDLPEITDAGTGWQAARRAAVLTALLSASPNLIVVEVDAEAGTALVHRLAGDR